MKISKKITSFRQIVLIPLIGILLCCKQNTQQTHQAQPQDSLVVHKQISIWSKSIPDSELIRGTETYNDGMVTNVSKPTITIYSPKGKNTGTAIIVFPGGGYNKLAIELEGS
jgi:acetyl esterase/lipase